MALGAIAMLFPFTAGSVLLFAAQKRAGANSAPAYWEGADATGVLVKGDSCPIAVEREVLTVEIPEFPPLGEDREAFDGYDAHVTAQYTFRNPTEEAYKATLLFPFGYPPVYAPGDYYSPGEYNFYSDTARYSVKENGEDVAVRSRHSYCRGDGRYIGADFDAIKEINSLEGEDESFFKDDTPVTQHTFHVTVPEAESERVTFLTLCFKLIADPAKTRIAASAPSNMFVEKGLAVIGYGFAQSHGDFDFSLYVFGEDATVKKKAVYDYHGVDAIEGSAVEETGTTTETYAAFVSERYPGEESGMSWEDWERGFTMALGMNVNYDVLCTTSPDEICATDFMRWYEYDLDFPAGEEIVNEVTAPIYPTVHGSGKNKKYDYTYLLSPARNWASFGSLHVEIKTPYFLTESSLDYEKTEEGYAFDWEDGLPLGELTFTLMETEPTGSGGFTPFGSGFDALSITIIIFAALLAVAGIVTTVCIVVVRRKRTARSGQGAAREGKVDLPPERDVPPDDNEGKKR